MRKSIILLFGVCLLASACDQTTPLNHDFNTSTVYIDHVTFDGQDYKDLFFPWTDPTQNTEQSPTLSTVTIPFTIMVAGTPLTEDLRFYLYQQNKNTTDDSFFAPLKGYPGFGKSYIDFDPEGYVLPAGRRSVTVDVVFLHDHQRFTFNYYDSASMTTYNVAVDGYLMTFGLTIDSDDDNLRVSAADLVSVRINKGY